MYAKIAAEYVVLEGDVSTFGRFVLMMAGWT